MTKLRAAALVAAAAGVLAAGKAAIDVFTGEYFRDYAPREIAYSLWVFLLLAASVAFYEFLLALTRRRPAHSGIYVWMRNIVLGAAAIGLVCGYYAFNIEPNWLEVTHVRLESAKLAQATAPIRLVVISDLHLARTVGLEAKLPAVIAAERPDLIFFLGDAVNTSHAVGRFNEVMTALCAIAPVVAVRGNQDRGALWESRSFYGGTGVLLLDGQSITTPIHGAQLYIWGQDYATSALLPQPTTPAGAFTILLYHSPELMDDAARDAFDLYLAGHTHGGQVALPFFGAIVTYTRTGRKYQAGLYREGSTTLYVNRGIGLAHEPLPAARFLARPEVTVIDLSMGNR